MRLSRILILGILPIVMLALTAGPAAALGMTYNTGGDAITKVAELPETDEFRINGEFVDLGWLHKEWSLLGAAFYVFDEKGYVFYAENENGTTYYPDLSAADMARAGEAMGTTFPERYEMSLWQRWAGALVLGGLLILLLVRRIV